MRKILLKSFCVGIISFIGVLLTACGGDNGSGDNDGRKTDTPAPLNLSVFVDLSDRITKIKDEMTQAEKDEQIINGLADEFIKKQKREGFQKSNDVFQIVFYPAPAGSQNLADELSLALKHIKGPTKKKALLDFQANHSAYIKQLYDNALQSQDYFGSDIWGFFAKDKVGDLYRNGYRNVLVILSDGYVFDKNNKIKEGNNYSYILPQTLSTDGTGLIPCKISNSDLEIYFIECNANPQTDYPKMKSILDKWFKDMGITVVDIQDTDIPANTLKHLKNRIFLND